MYKNRHGIVWSTRDTWNLFVPLGETIVSAVKKFKEVLADPQNSLQSYPISLESFEKWIWVLDEIIWTFSAVELDEYNIFTEEYFDLLAKSRTSLKYPFETDDPELMAKLEAARNKYLWADTCLQIRRKRGMDLFAEHFRSLWW